MNIPVLVLLFKTPRFFLMICFSVMVVIAIDFSFLGFQTHGPYCQAQNISEEKYNDFYRLKKQNAERDRIRELSRLKYMDLKKQEDKKKQQIEADYAKENNRKKQELFDQKAEAWMEEQNQIHQDKLNEARLKYMSSKKENNKFKIPESEEYEVQ